MVWWNELQGTPVLFGFLVGLVVWLIGWAMCHMRDMFNL